jgi:hypothetical protein
VERDITTGEITVYSYHWWNIPGVSYSTFFSKIHLLDRPLDLYWIYRSALYVTLSHYHIQVSLSLSILSIYCIIIINILGIASNPSTFWLNYDNNLVSSDNLGPTRIQGWEREERICMISLWMSSSFRLLYFFFELLKTCLLLLY